VLILVLLSAAGVVRGVDLDLNGLGDVWENRYRATNLANSADADGDGRSNGEENAAGTDPRSGGSFIAVSGLYVSNGLFWVSWPGQAGKRYVVQSSAGLVAGWSNVTSVLVGTNELMTTAAGPVSGRGHFRVLVTDTDSDGDGVLDWEEYQLGMNPLRSDSDHDGALDLAEVQTEVTSPNTVTIVAVDSAATETNTDPAVFRVYRSGGMGPVTVNLQAGGSAVAGVDYAALPATVTVPFHAKYVDVALTAFPDSSNEVSELVSVTLLPGAGYAVGAASVAWATVADVAGLDGTGLTGRYYDNASSTYANATNFTVLRLTRVDAGVGFDWTTNSPDLSMDTNTYSIRWIGQVRPQYTEAYTFRVRSDDGCKLWVNGQLILDAWANGGTTTVRTATVNLQADVRYDLKLEYYENTGSAACLLEWYSPSQPAVVIPGGRLYPETNGPTAACATVIGPRELSLVVGLGTSNRFYASNPPSGVSATGVPPGLVFGTNGVLSGVPSQAGFFAMRVTASNALGSSSTLCEITVTNGVGSLAREVWNALPGTDLATIPLTQPADMTNIITSLNSPTNALDNFGERWSGTLIAPDTGNYYFWIAASGPAELWISTDDDHVNRVRRAFVTNATGFQAWNTEPRQKSPWLALEAGRTYYLEVLHKDGAGNEHCSVGWSRPGEPTNAPSGIVPGAVLQPHVEPAWVMGEPALYTATLGAAGGTNSGGWGSASLALAFDEETAAVTVSAGGLSSPTNGITIRSAAHAGAIVLNVLSLTSDAEGVRTWTIAPAGGLTTEEILAALKAGDLYVSVATTAQPGGELSGDLRLSGASRYFTPPAAAAPVPLSPVSSQDAVRFLNQATFGATTQDIAEVQALGITGWMSNQFNLPPTSLHAFVTNYYTVVTTNAESSTDLWRAWWKTALTAPDQLRHRVAFALSQILVVSEDGVLDERTYALANYHDLLATNAFGNFRTLLEAVTLSPAMGRYLDMYRNDKPDYAAGRGPNENYAREILQLFSIGVRRMWPDGTAKLNRAGLPVDTYDQPVIVGFAHVFTGWDNFRTNVATTFGGSTDYTRPMSLVQARHDTNTNKRLLDNVVLPSGQDGSRAGTDDLREALDLIFEHPNTGPFICRQLIQRLVTGNPSPGYLYRVAQVFDDNGAGVRGDLKAVVTAILTDPEARDRDLAMTKYTHGHLREPVLRVSALFRAFGLISNQTNFNMGSITDLNQTPLRAPTVFNYYEPDYAFPGAITAAGVTSPEFQITSESTVVSTANRIYSIIDNSDGTNRVTTVRGHNSDVEILLDGLMAMAHQPTNLVQHVHLMLAANQLSPSSLSLVQVAVNGMTIRTNTVDNEFNDRRERAQAAVFLISTAPECATQR
jgi:uncharacterized protein (DUF1800 family)